jgi:signal peptidase I
MTTTGDGRWPTADDAGGPDDAARRRSAAVQASPQTAGQPSAGPPPAAQPAEPGSVNGGRNGTPVNGLAGLNGHRLTGYPAPPVRRGRHAAPDDSGDLGDLGDLGGPAGHGEPDDATRPSLFLPPRARPGLPPPAPAGLPQSAPPGLPQSAPPGLPQSAPPGLPQSAPPGLPQSAPSGLPPPAHPGLPLPGLPQSAYPALPARPEPVPDLQPAPGYVPRYQDPADEPTEVFDRLIDLGPGPPAPPPQAVALPYAPTTFAASPLAPPPLMPPAGGHPLEVLPPGQGAVAPEREQTRTDRPSHPGRAALRRKRRRRRMLEWPFLVVFSLLTALLLRTFVVQTFYIPSESMHDTLLEGDRVLVNKLAYHFHDLNRGDVVVFRRPPNIDITDEDLIKRVIGLPGEKVEGHDRHVYINGRQLQEPYVQARCTGTADFPAVTVPPGHAFVMGDNRCDSTDSRVFGPIDTSLVVGRAFVLIWPFGRIGWL